MIEYLSTLPIHLIVILLVDVLVFYVAMGAVIGGEAAPLLWDGVPGLSKDGMVFLGVVATVFWPIVFVLLFAKLLISGAKKIPPAATAFVRGGVEVYRKLRPKTPVTNDLPEARIVSSSDA